jgi:nitrite reductase/ring-hydroxylating ferredoxin subunit/uncharacterized membrane protein
MGTSIVHKTVSTVENQPGLDPLGEALQKAIKVIYKAGGPVGLKIKDFLHGTWLGHPLHPVLTDVPIGAWTLALVLDLLEVNTRKKSFGVGADTAVAVGVGGALASAVTGLTDWQHLKDRPRRTGLVHAFLNIVATLLYTLSWLMRRRRNRSAGRGFGLAGFTVSMAAGYLGGDLVFTQRIGVDHTIHYKPPEKFVDVMPVEDLPEAQLVRAEVEGVPVLLVRRGKKIYALAETCTHLGGPLAEGKLEDYSVVCPWHDSRFDLRDGHVVNGPATHPESCFETRVYNGQLQIRIATRSGVAVR